MRSAFVAALAVLPLVVSCSSEPKQLTVEIVATHPGDPTAFTQGLEVSRSNPQELLVGTGWYGESRILRRTVDGRELASQPLLPQEFGEGITQHGDEVWQLTWQNGAAYRRHSHTFEVTDQATFDGEGWGLCSFDDALIMSDGTSSLRVLDPETFAEKERVDTGVDKLNELECVGDAVYANRFLTTDIYKFDRKGHVTAIIDASGLPNNAAPDSNNVLNGIAHIPGTDRFYLTGKRWPDIYEVRFVEKN